MNITRKATGNTTFPSVVPLNIGGTIYSASLATLTRYPKSMLAVMFSGRHPLETDANGNYFIDRDGKLFRYVLNFLRSSFLNLPKGFDEFEQLKLEADFYQIKDLLASLNKTTASKEAPLARANNICYEHIEIVCRPRFVEVFGKKSTMEECFQKSLFSGYVTTECTSTTEGTANLEVKITNRRGDYVGNEPKTTILQALGKRGFTVVCGGYLQDQRSPTTKEILLLSRIISS